MISSNRPLQVRVEIGRLVFFGAGICSTACGLVAFVGAIRLLLFGPDESLLPRGGLTIWLGTFAVGVVIYLVGMRLDQRRFDAAREIKDAQQRADLHQ